MRTDWKGHYLDGRTAARQQVVIRLMRQGLQVSMENGVSFFWRYRDLRQTQGFYAGEQVRLEKGQEIPEVLLISDAAFLTDIRRLAPELTGHFHNPARRGTRAALTLLAALGAAAASAALYLWGIPATASVVASRVPVSWEERLGQVVVEQLAPPGKRCADPARARMLEEITATLTAPLPNTPYTFRVIVVNNPIVNALAAPGGYILVFRGLLERTRSPEELAGVLAHEFQHVLKRHATRALLQNVSSGLLVAALMGDASGIMAFGLEGARTLGALRYSRQNEEEADAEGMRLLIQAGIDPAGMIAFFEVLQRGDRRGAALFQYLSTHPQTQERVKRLKLLAAQSQVKPVNLLPNYDWRDIRKICQRRVPPA
jgi:predicted Zn-dependent protease